MKVISRKAKLLIYPLILLVMGIATFEYINITVLGATCCSYGSQCPEGIGKVPVLRCCNPGVWEAPCSQQKANYCRESCG